VRRMSRFAKGAGFGCLFNDCVVVSEMRGEELCAWRGMFLMGAFSDVGIGWGMSGFEELRGKCTVMVFWFLR
jgi:hypothetical protein